MRRRLVLAFAAAVLLLASCGFREVRCEEHELSDGTVCLACSTHNNISEIDSEPNVDCSEQEPRR